MTLLEVVMAVLIIAIVSVAMLRALTLSAQCGYHASLGSSALYRCQEKMEEILDDQFLLIEPERYPPEQGLVLDTRGTTNQVDDVYFDRKVEITDESTEDQFIKRVSVTVTWQVAGLQDTRQLKTLVAREGR